MLFFQSLKNMIVFNGLSMFFSLFIDLYICCIRLLGNLPNTHFSHQFEILSCFSSFNCFIGLETFEINSVIISAVENVTTNA